MEKATHANDDTDTWMPLSVAAERVINSLKTSKISESTTLSSFESGASEFRGGEAPNDSKLPADADRSPVFIYPGLFEVNAPISSGVFRYNPVGLILGRCSFSQVAEPIIGTVPVDVVDLLFGPSTVNEEPDEPMGHVVAVIDMNSHSTALIEGARDSTDQMMVGIAKDVLSSKNSSIWIVSEQPPELFASDNWRRSISSFHLHTLLILNKLTISTKIKEIEKRNMSEDSHGQCHGDAEHADEHECGTLANIR